MKNNLSQHKKAAVSIVCLFSLLCTAFAYNGNTPEQQVFLDAASVENSSQLESFSNYIDDINYKATSYRLTNIAATITFSDYISFDELKAFIEKYGIEVEELTIRSIDSNGDRLTTTTLVSLGLDETESLLQMDAAMNDYTVIGIASLCAYIDYNQIDPITSDPISYVVDTSGDMRLSPNAVSENDNNQSSFAQPLTWNLEDMGILNISNYDFFSQPKSASP